MASIADMPMPPAPGIQPLGNGPSFSYSRALRPEHAAAASSGSSWAGESAGPGRGLPTPEVQPFSPTPLKGRRERIVTTASFTIEELSDFGGSDAEARADVVRPSAIEYAESEPGGPGRMRRKAGGGAGGCSDVEQTIMLNLGNLKCIDDDDNDDNDNDDEEAAGAGDSDTDYDEAEYRAFLLKRRDKQKRRVSVGKRTISESIGSDSDREDLEADPSIDELGPSARRTRRRLSSNIKRHSLLFQGPAITKIEELNEPASGEEYEETVDGEVLARQLPYYSLRYISMEVDSS